MKKINSDLYSSLYDNYKYKMDFSISEDEFKEFVSDQIDSVIVEYFQPELYARTVMQQMSGTSPIYTWQDTRGGIADVLSESDEPPRTKMSYGRFTARSFRIGSALEFTNESLQDIEIDLLTTHIADSVRNVARKENQYMMGILSLGVADGSSGYKSGEVYSSHVLDASDSNWEDGGTDKEYTHEKLQVMLQILEEENFTGDTALLHPAQYTQILKLNQFKDSDSIFQFLSPSSVGILEGNRSKELLGAPKIRTVVSPYVEKDEVIIFDSKVYAKYWVPNELKMYQIPDYLRDMITISMRERVGAFIKRPSASVKIENLTYSNPTVYASS